MSDTYSSLIVKGALWALVLFSIVTWALILAKGTQSWRVARNNQRFQKAFWSAGDLPQAAALGNPRDSALGRVAHAAFTALTETSEGLHDLEHSWDRLESLERLLRQQIVKERGSLESGLAILASVGSTAPFVGLFGTVFGIVHAMTAISQNGTADIGVVAGPIGEALVTTGVGIAVAVPAVLAYNFFVRRLKVTGGVLDDFGTDLISLAQKSNFRIRPFNRAAPDESTAPIDATSEGAYV
ncbi:motA/TolQ/ExbB proton channel family protein [Paraburkholderia xenovorans LB400]|uniref:Outer membrane transport energization protein ExbB n=1 Tax=Paraburkholderia xenovorans (strain LB400) TaxID=266265 RepID=Q13ID9_PARXL|nr:MotA/TolQ/ExbB proton channel family protein [Paraburkholderia xenovorans]ABE36150.1 outer membrane transport energization protein ExbB [Paraburkholderia xenovorans LB400]AIP35005.1 motA/TolQ/ExbB proton channel family protein [Paraburkholderia xenovorans LB400]